MCVVVASIVMHALAATALPMDWAQSEEEVTFSMPSSTYWLASDEEAAPSQRSPMPRLMRKGVLGKEMRNLLHRIPEQMREAAAAPSEKSSSTSARQTEAGAKDEASATHVDSRRSQAGAGTDARRQPVRVAANDDGSQSTAQKRPRTAKYSFEFFKAEIMDIVKAISDITQKNFIIPEKLKSQRITILSPAKISRTEAYQVFLTALAVNGITLVRSGRYYKLVESRESIKKPIPTCIGPDDECPRYSEQMVTRLVRLTYLEASQISTVIKSLISKAGQMTTFQPSNALIISEYAPNMQRLLRIIRSLDVVGFEDELQLVQIEYATAAEVASMLTQVFEIKAGAARSKGSSRKSPISPSPSKSEDMGEVQISKIIADERTNQIIIKANKRSFDAIRALIAKLDVPISEAEQGRIHVYYLENAKAEELSSTLSTLAQGSNPTRNTRIPVKTAKAASAGKSAVLFEGEVKITADKATNSLIIVASAHDYRSLRSLIQKLDRPRRQVYVEAAILEVSASDSEDLFLHWHAPGRFSENDLGSKLGGSDSVGFIQSGPFSNPEQGITPTLLASDLLAAVGGSITGIVGKSFTLPGTDLSVPSFGVVLNWIKKDSTAQVLSTPHILTMDNEKASIEVGKKIPFRRGAAIPTNLMSSLASSATGGTSALGGLSSLGGLGSMFASTDRIDVKLKLALTPQITEDNRIRLEVEQQIEDVVGQEGSVGQPTTSNRNIQTVVVVEDQQTVVLGGLMRDNVTEGESKVPILGDIPILGWFFRSKTTKTEKVNLLLVLRVTKILLFTRPHNAVLRAGLRTRSFFLCAVIVACVIL